MQLYLLINIVGFCLGARNSTSKRSAIVDYDYYYEYETNNNGSSNSRVHSKIESFLLPNPGLIEPVVDKYEVDTLPKVDLPDDSLSDTDLRDHDFIDNLMYVYYGSHAKPTANYYGQEITIVGAVLACAAQLLTIFVVLVRKSVRANGKKDVACIFLQIMLTLTMSNLVFMLGVYSTRNIIKCQIIGVMLYYFHLVTAFWLFLYSYFVYKKFCKHSAPNLQTLNVIAYSVPALFTLVSILIAPRSYETKRFCFISVQKGMIVNYMLPVSLLIISTTVYCLNGIRKINMELVRFELTSSAESLNVLRQEFEEPKKAAEIGDSCIENEILSLKECKRCLKVLCIVQTSFDIAWFVAVLALENIHYSNSMPIAYSIICCLLNWYILLRTKAFLPTIVSSKLNLDGVTCSGTLEQVKIVQSNGTLASSDSIPLLVNSETEMLEMASSAARNNISTITN